MAGGFLGLPGLFGGSPLNALSSMVPDGTDQGSPSPPPPAPAPAPAPADPATTGSIGGGGSSSRGIGDMLGDAISGKGLMGAQPGDDKVDPGTGVSAGQMRSMSMQSMMGMGLTLLAAGMRQSDDSRAAILAGAPKMLDNSSSLNNFAKMRLEMAGARLKERQAANADEQARRWGSIFGGSGAASGVPGAAPSAPAALPGTIAPPGAVVQPGGPMPAAAAATPGPAGAAIAAPAQPNENPLLSGISPGVRTILGALGPEKGMEKLLDVRRGLDEQETIGEPRVDAQSGQVVADKMKNGKKTGIQVIGSQSELSGPEIRDPTTGAVRRDKMRGGNIVGSESLGTMREDPQDVEERTASAKIRMKRFEDLSGRLPAVQQASESYNKLVEAEKNVRGMKTLAGPGADLKTEAANLLGGLGMLTDEGREALRNTADVGSFLKQSAGEFAKKYYGPQISNADVENAQKAIGGVMSNDPAVVADALKRIRLGHKQTIEAFNSEVDSHEKRLKGTRSESLLEDMRVPRVDNKFAEPEVAKPAAAAATPVVEPKPAAVEHLKANPKLREAFDKKFGAGASARYLGN